MIYKILRDLAQVCAIVLVPGLLAWLFGRPMIFPSLGPSALAIVLDERGNRFRQVIGGHLFGALCGLVAYHVLAPGLSLAVLTPALSADGLRIVASGVLSVGLTSLAVLTTRTTHAPACATTLIVSLSVLPSILDGTLIMIAVLVMFLSYRLVRLAWKSDTLSL